MALDEETKRHREIYDGFIKFAQWGTVLTVLALILMAIFLL